MKNLRIIILLAISILFLSCSDFTAPKEDFEFNIYPNPLTDKCLIYFSLAYPEDVSIYITDNSGRMIKEFKQALPGSEIEIGLDLRNQPSGVYSCILEIRGHVYIKEFTIIR